MDASMTHASAVSSLEPGELDAAFGRFFIDGAWMRPAGEGRIPVVDPASESVFAEVAAGGPEDVDRAVAAARRAFPAFAATPLAQRCALLERIRRLLLERAEQFADILTREMGATHTHVRAAHVPFAAEHIRATREAAEVYPFETLRGSTAILQEPIGVCGLITPWNWPLYQITAKVAPALAAGCTVVLKPSELSPLSALLFARVIQDAGIPRGVFNLVNGTGPEVGAGMASHPDIDMISITGSNRAGVLVARAAAPTVKRVTQELGGKSPNVLLPDADLKRAVPLGVAAAFRNVGQSCSAPTRMIVPRELLPHVEALARKAVERLVVGPPADPSTDLGPIANKAQFERVQAMIAQGLERGFYVRPTIFSDVRNEMRIAQEEIFGPVLCLIPYDSIDEAVRIANATVYGLGGHVQSANVDRARAVARRIRSGQVLINHPSWDPFAPFGGYKQSGNGREYGAHGLSEYLEVKAVMGFEPAAEQAPRH
jgi:aldehyde dehydrogenase (NAD+)